MSVNLIEMASNYLTPSILQKLGNLVGLNQQQTQKTMGAIIPTALAGLIQSASTESGAKRLLDTIDEGGFDGSVIENMENMPTDKLGGIVQRGKGLLGDIFGARTDGIGDLLSKFTGAGKSSVTSLLAAAAPMLLGLLGKLRNDQGLSAGGVRELLLSQKGLISKFAPPGLANVMGLSSLSDLGGAAEAVRAKAAGFAGQVQDRALDEYSSASRRVAAAPSNTGAKWLAAGLACLALLAGLWWLRDRLAHRPETATPVAQKPATPAAPSLQGEPVSNLVTTQLPSGATLRALPGSTAARLVEFLKNRVAGAQPERIVFEEVQFEPGGTLTSGSNRAVENVALVAKEFPDNRIRVRSYTMEGGAPQNSIERANQVRAALIEKGAPSERVIAEAAPGDAAARAPAGNTSGWTELIIEAISR
jgi:outer membrane protein OmpA-like peptidoglycan-associated protein